MVQPGHMVCLTKGAAEEKSEISVLITHRNNSLNYTDYISRKTVIVEDESKVKGVKIVRQ